jgi:hypothetical protein
MLALPPGLQNPIGGATVWGVIAAALAGLYSVSYSPALHTHQFAEPDLESEIEIAESSADYAQEDEELDEISSPSAASTSTTSSTSSASWTDTKLDKFELDLGQVGIEVVIFADRERGFFIGGFGLGALAGAGAVLCCCVCGARSTENGESRCWAWCCCCCGRQREKEDERRYLLSQWTQ